MSETVHSGWLSRKKADATKWERLFFSADVRGLSWCEDTVGARFATVKSVQQLREILVVDIGLAEMVLCAESETAAAEWLAAMTATMPRAILSHSKGSNDASERCGEMQRKSKDSLALCGGYVNMKTFRKTGIFAGSRWKKRWLTVYPRCS